MKAKTVQHRQEVVNPEVPFSRKIKLDTGTQMPSNEITRQYLQEDRTFCQSLQKQNRESDTRGKRDGQ